ncbi:MAG TPA: SGNH/GDSL hydrolase family protein [Xanthobacteraceae bacterium]|nr:SGNH/GDSL hydrolase family protein [Xanthobacteraceae bacterium]
MRSRLARRTGWLLLGLAELAVAAITLLALLPPASAQIDDRFPFLEERRRRYQQTYPGYQQPQWGSPFGFEQPRQQPVDSSRAPAPRRTDATPTTKIIVFGDSMADWLAYGLEDAFSDTPEIGVLRKHRTNSGLIRVDVRGESYDWPSAARDLINHEKPDYVVMMIGLADRRGIREAIRQPARPPAGQKQQPQPAQQAQPAAAAAQAGAQQQAAAPAAQPAPAKPADAEASPQAAPDAAQDSDQSNVIAPETAVAGTVVHEFRSEKWGELYSRRVDEMIGVLKAKNVPVFWVGLPAVRGSRATSEMVYLNDLYRGRAEKAGITYIDVWDGFVDDSGTYSNYGPDLEGQTRRLRSGDGVHFTRAGARKLAHYLEREIRRVMMANVPVATPLPQEPEPDTKAPPTAAAPGLPPRPAASPVMSLTAPKGAGDTLLGATPARSAGADSVATRVLVKGEPLEAPAGRADDFVWPRRDIVTATGVLPPDPVEPSEPAVAGGGGGTSSPAAVAAAPKPSAPRPRREPQHQQATHNGWGWFGRQQPYESRPQPRGGGFFGWFGGGRW